MLLSDTLKIWRGRSQEPFDACRRGAIATPVHYPLDTFHISPFPAGICVNLGTAILIESGFLPSDARNPLFALHER